MKALPDQSPLHPAVDGLMIFYFFFSPVEEFYVLFPEASCATLGPQMPNRIKPAEGKVCEGYRGEGAGEGRESLQTPMIAVQGELAGELAKSQPGR